MILFIYLTATAIAYFINRSTYPGRENPIITLLVSLFWWIQLPLWMVGTYWQWRDER